MMKKFFFIEIKFLFTLSSYFHGIVVICVMRQKNRFMSINNYSDPYTLNIPSALKGEGNGDVCQVLYLFAYF